jgi:hypothetical protein
MHRIFTGFTAVALASMVGLASFAPASAAPLSGITVASGSDVVQVQYNRDPPPPPRHGRHDRDRRGPPRDRPGNWNGYHGYDHRRPGYRRHSDGFWYPGGAFRIQIR